MALKPIYILTPLLVGWILDRLFGDPHYLPHPVIGYGKVINWGDKFLNKGKHKLLKGALFTLLLITTNYFILFIAFDKLNNLNQWFATTIATVLVFFSLCGKTLANEVKKVFRAIDESEEKGRLQLSYIVGRDTSHLTPQQIRIAALETLAENLSDGVIAPIFWYILLGVPGILTYKLINTLDSMLGYKNLKYKQFGCWAARIDDIANYIPARLTALFMALTSGKLKAFTFIKKYGNKHSSPNSGYPEATLAGILDCQFGGPNNYFGQKIEKAYIGNNAKTITNNDLKIAIALNFTTELAVIFFFVLYILIIYSL